MCPALSQRHRDSDQSRRLYLTEQQLREGIELMFFAYRDNVADSDKALEALNLGRAHHRALYFIGRHPELTVTELISVLAITKQSLNRVLKPLIEQGFVKQTISTTDRRKRHLSLTEAGKNLEETLFHPQKNRMREAFRSAGQESVEGFRKVLTLLIEAEHRDIILKKIIQHGEENL